MKKANVSKNSRRATILYRKGNIEYKKEVPAARAFLIADEYKRKTGQSVKVKIS